MFIFKAKEYQSEKSPIFDSQKRTKTTRKLHILSQLYAAKVCQLFCNTRYLIKFYKISSRFSSCNLKDFDSFDIFYQQEELKIFTIATHSFLNICVLLKHRNVNK